jgi:plastocyanin
MRTVHLLTTAVTLAMLGIVGSGCSSDSSNPYASSATGPSVTPTPTPSPVAANTVLMAGSVFSPASITVAVGTTVTWKNNDGIAHTSTSDTGVWDTGNIPAGGSTTTTFNTAGQFPYHCTYHLAMGMKGVVIVQ